MTRSTSRSRRRCLGSRKKGGGAKIGNKDTRYEERKVAQWQSRLDAKRKRSHSAPPAPRTPQTMEATQSRTEAED